MKPLCVVSCPIDTFSGYGARSRDFVKSLIKEKDSEWDIKILPQRWGECPWNFLSQDNSLRQRFIGGLQRKPDVWVQITVPNEFQAVGTFNIGVSAGIETNIYPAEFIDGSNKMDLNLVSSQHSKNVAQQSQFEKKNQQGQVERIIKLEKPIEVLFEGLDLDKYYKNSNKTSILDDVNEEFCFLYTGHWLPGAYGEDRKNTATLIKSFLETFNTPSKNKPALILKTNHVNYSLMDRVEILKKINEIKTLIKGNLPNIYLLHGEMTDDEMNELNNDPRVKSFVSFTKGEGFGRPLLEAAVTGKPVITTNWSGHIDFLHPDYNVLIGGELKKVHESAANQFLLKDSQWFNINTAIASRAMKDVFNHYKKYHEKSRKQTQYIKDNFSFDKMGKILNNLLPGEDKIPVMKPLKLPNLKKIELPKLKKVEL
jgi:glycosyltransferase involved in cell wall biosynthesis